VPGRGSVARIGGGLDSLKDELAGRRVVCSDVDRAGGWYRLRRLVGPIRLEAATVRGLEFVEASLSFVLNPGVLRGLFLGAGSIRVYRDSAD